MPSSIFTELSLVIAIAAGMSFIMRLIKQPMIIGYILTGIIVGPTALHLVQSADTIEVFASIGIALLLFIIGLGLNLQVIREVGKVATIAGVTQVLLIGILGWGSGLMVGLPQSQALFLGIALSLSSTIIILKLLSDKKEQTRLHGKIAIGLLIIQDLIASIVLIFEASSSSGKGFSLNELLLLVFKGSMVVVPMFIITVKVLPKFKKFIAGSSEFLFLFALGWGFGIAALADWLGFSIEIGALLAGVALASLPYSQEISARLRPLRDFFIVVFFVALGTRIDFASLGGMINLLIISSVIVIIIKPLVVLIIMGLMGYTKRTSFKTAITMGQVSEFSLVFVILGAQQGSIPESLVSMITMVALISIAVSTYAIIYSDSIFTAIEKHLILFERRKTHFETDAKHSYTLVLFGYQKGGQEFLKVFKQMNKKYVVVDYDPENIDALEHHKAHYIYGDATDIELLEEIGLDKAKLIASTITDYETNVFLAKLVEKTNPNAVLILRSDTVEQAEELYTIGASYVMMPHYIGSEKIGSFIKKSGLSKAEFKKFREKHLAYLRQHYILDDDHEEDDKI